MNKPPRIEEVTATPPATLTIRWSTGEMLTADIGDWISRFALLAPLRDESVFSGARVGWYGHGVEWGDGVEVGGDQLYSRCRAQAGEPSPAEFDAWMRANNLSLASAAEAIGMSRRMVANYRTGSKPIPRHVWLACIGWETIKGRRAA